MDEPELIPESESHAAADASEPPPERRRRRRWIGLLLLLVALAVVGWFGWQWWQQRSADQAAARAQMQRNTQRDQALPAVQARLGELDTKLADLRERNASLRAELGAGEDSGRALRQQVSGMNARIAQIEAALADLSRQRLSGRDSMLVNEAEMLLQLGQQRYELFGDAAAAMQAFALADRSLAALGNPGFASVRQSIAREREALAASEPLARSSALAAVQHLREQWQALPLKAAHVDQSAASAEQGVWQRIGNTLANLVRVRREAATDPVSRMDASLARQLGALNLAQAQAALLASDSESFRNALQRSESLIAHAFNADAPAVGRLHSELERLQASFNEIRAPAQLGGALQALRNLHAIGAMTRDALAPADEPVMAPASTRSTAPAPAPDSTPAAAGSAA